MSERKLDPDMPSDELRLHMGELTPDEVLVARSAIRWANSRISSEWKTIDTAPFLERIIVAGEAVYPHTGWYVCEASNDSTGKFYTEQGELKNQPTHWMPLPDAPTNSKEGI